MEYKGIDTENGLGALPVEKLYEYRDAAKKESWKRGIMSHSQKIFMNSIYGATGSDYYRFRHEETVSDITAESRHFIKTSERFMNDWIHFEWHKSTDLHKKLRAHKDIKEHFADAHKNVGQLPKKDYVIYIDTDSIYVEFGDILKSIGFTGINQHVARFIMILNDLAIRDMFQSKFDKLLIGERHCKNYFKFDLETVSSVSFFLAKKKYLNAYTMMNDIVYDTPTDNIYPTGIELIQSSTPGFCRDFLKFLVKGIVSGGLVNANYNKTMQKMFAMFASDKYDVENVCNYVSLNKYDKMVTAADADGWSVAKGALAQYKGAARYNHLLIKHDLLSKYRPIVNHKVAWYVDPNNTPFAFHPGQFPKEIAPVVNYKEQFNRIIVKPISRLAVLADINVSDSPHRKHFTPNNIF